MTASALDTIIRALRYIGAVDIRESVDAADATVALVELQDLIPSLPGWTQWNEVEVNVDYTANDDERISVVGDVAVTITLPQLVFDKPYIIYSDSGVSIKYGTYYRAPRDGARVQVSAQQGTDNYYYAYRSDTGKWIEVSSLAVGDELPTNSAMDGHLAALLAERLSPIWGLPVSRELNGMIAKARNAFVARYATQRYDPDSPANAQERMGQFM